MILTFGKPKRAMSKEAHQSISADGAPPGVYVPNMSKVDAMKWKAKLVGQKTGRHQIEIRRDGVVIIVGGEKGYKYKWYDKRKPNMVHLATSGPMILTDTEFEQMVLAVSEASVILGMLDNGDGDARKAVYKTIREGDHPLDVAP
jgi:uncharacterized protein YigE (DUF2233 family)